MEPGQNDTTPEGIGQSLPVGEARAVMLAEVNQSVTWLAGALLAFRELVEAAINGEMVGEADFNQHYGPVIQSCAATWTTPAGGAVLKALLCGGGVQDLAEFLQGLIPGEEMG